GGAAERHVLPGRRARRRQHPLQHGRAPVDVGPPGGDVHGGQGQAQGRVDRGGGAGPGRQVPAPPNDRGWRGRRCRHVLRLRPGEGRDRPAPHGQLRRVDALMGSSASPKRVVVWGTGFVGRMVIPEVVRHPRFELAGVGVSSPHKVGKDVGEICGIEPVGVAATDDVEALIALAPDALVHYGPTAAHAPDNIRDITTFLRAGIDVCSTAMTPWVWPAMTLNPPNWITPVTEACEAGGSSCFTTGIDPGFANDLFPMTLMGLCGEVRQVRALEILDYINYEGDYEQEMGIGRPPEFVPLLEHTDILVMSWGATVPMIAHA